MGAEEETTGTPEAPAVAVLDSVEEEEEERSFDWRALYASGSILAFCGALVLTFFFVSGLTIAADGGLGSYQALLAPAIFCWIIAFFLLSRAKKTPNV